MWAFVSASNKKGLVEFAQQLNRANYNLLCTDGTFRFLQEHGLKSLHSVASVTNFPEMLGGRVKSLHPKIFGGILADRANDSHVKDVEAHTLPDIRVVVANLYPFSPLETDLETAVSLMDVGGVAAVRAAAKNFKHVSVFTDPQQYSLFDRAVQDMETRQVLAKEAFELTCHYDAQISSFLANRVAPMTTAAPTTVTRRYDKVCDLKYGCNPHQGSAALYSSEGGTGDLKLLNGNWGFINILDAVNSFGLAHELSQELDGKPVATSFKHTMPAGCAVATKWSEIPESFRQGLKVCFGVDESSSEAVVTYARARNADPLSSFGDFIGYSGEVDAELATFISKQISDGIIAASYTDEALKILSQKKKGSFVIIECQKKEKSRKTEFRDVAGGLTLVQEPNDLVIDRTILSQNIPTKVNQFPDSSLIDLVIANSTIKFTQSNSIAAASNGQIIAVGAGQQSRVDAVRIVAEKTRVFLNRHTDSLLNYFSHEAKGARQDKIVASTNVAKGLDGVQFTSDDVALSMASDGFFPFGDGIDEAAKIPGLKYISQPGGSVKDDTVIETCDKYGFGMSITGKRVFSH
jgi:phosphoribosylaminoimidazolecarboxamide formyltransferase/IMP cyclohydrolase